jgi:hypothetical protein
MLKIFIATIAGLVLILVVGIAQQRSARTGTTAQTKRIVGEMSTLARKIDKELFLQKQSSNEMNLTNALVAIVNREGRSALHAHSGNSFRINPSLRSWSSDEAQDDQPAIYIESPATPNKWLAVDFGGKEIAINKEPDWPLISPDALPSASK